MFGGKAGIVADYQTALSQPSLSEVIGYALRTSPHIIKGEVLSDDSPPAIGAEFNWAVYLPHPLYPPLL